MNVPMIAATRTSPDGQQRAVPREDQAIVRGVALAALTAIAAIHALQVPDALRETGYLGGLFIALVVACVALAAVLPSSADPRLVDAAGVLAGVVLVGYLVSRTTGLPGFTGDVGEWAEPLGLVSIVAEGLLVSLVSVARLT